MKTLALFDFDGTLYKKDSLLEFTKFSKGLSSFYWGMLVLSPYLIALKLKLLSNEKAKIKFITHFFKGTNYNDFLDFCSNFAIEINKNINPALFLSFKKHLQNNDTLFIVTASAPEWIEPWSKNFNVTVIGTKIKIIDSIVTGQFTSKNCYGSEKVNRIKEQINLDEYDSIYTYGLGKGDIEMLALSK